MREKLTKRTIEALKPEKGKQYRVFDSSLLGFGIQVNSSGTKTFVLQYGPKTRRRRMKIGTFGPMTVEQARRAAKDAIRAYEEGGDPIDDRQKRRKTPTFTEWIEETDEKWIRAEKKAPEFHLFYLKLACDAFGKKKITDITSADIATVRDRFLDEGKHVSANRFLACVRASLNRAWRAPHELIESNPAARLQPGRDFTPRDRVATADELEQLAKAMSEHRDPHVRAAFVILAETGARSAEVLAAKWEDVDLDEGVWRLPETKSEHLRR